MIQHLFSGIMYFLTCSVTGNVLGIISIILGVWSILISLRIKQDIKDKDTIIDLLIEKTKYGRITWKPIVDCKEFEEIEDFLVDNWIPCDYGVNSIRYSQSYYIKSRKGYLLLLELYHGFPEITSPELDTIALIEFDNKKSAICISNFEEIEQAELYTLKNLIQNRNIEYSVINTILNK